MRKLIYTFAMSIISVILFQLYFYFANVNAEMLYTVGTFSIIVLYFLIGFPTLLIVTNKPTILARSIRYLLATLIGIVLFVLFYIKIGQLELNQIIDFLIPYSFIFGIIAGLIYFLPIEIMRRVLLSLKN